MLDTNTVSQIIRGPIRGVRDHLARIPMSHLCISAITQAELLYGPAKKPGAKALHTAVNEFLLRVEVLPWDSDAAEQYAMLRSQAERDGTPLGNLDMLIAAHAMASADVLVTSDRAFFNLKSSLRLADWTRDAPDEDFTH